MDQLNQPSRSEIDFEHIFDLSPNYICILDLEHNIIRANQAMADFIGISTGELVGLKCFQCLHQMDEPPSFCELSRMLDDGQKHTDEMFIEHLNGWFSVSATPLRNKEGNITGAIHIASDITERKKAEDALQESNQRMSSIYNTVAAVIFHLAVEGEEKYRFISVNRAFCDVTGLKQEQVVGKIVNVVIPEPSLTMVLGKYKQAIDENRIIRWEETSDYPTGRLIGEVSIAPVIDDKGRCINLVGSVLDITERKQSEIAVQESEEKYRTLFDTMLYGIVYQDENGKIVSTNPAAEHILGLSVDQMQGRTSIDPRWKSIHEDSSDFPGDTHPAMVALRTGKPVKNEIMGVFHPETEEYCWININAIPQFKQGEKKPFQVYTTFEDITERKKAEEKLWESEERFRTIYENAPVMIDAFDKDGRCLMWNKECEKTFGWTFEELKAYDDPMSLFFHDPKMKEQVLTTATSEPEKIFREWNPQTKDGTVLTCMFANFSLTDGTVINLGYDITKLKKAEEVLKKKSEELENLNTYFVNREFQMIELKKEINELLIKSGGEKKYVIHK